MNEGDRYLPQCSDESEAFIVPQMLELNELIIDKLNKLRRESNTKLLEDFVDYLNKHYYPISDDEVMEKQINIFLDERDKK